MSSSTGSPGMFRSFNRLVGPATRRGFTLIEIVVAMTILALALAALLQIFGADLRGVSVAEDRVIAMLLAKSKLAEVGPVLPVNATAWDGDYAGRFHWRIDVALAEFETAFQPED